jgi:CBS domain containing-hemolysin-like protein
MDLRNSTAQVMSPTGSSPVSRSMARQAPTLSPYWALWLVESTKTFHHGSLVSVGMTPTWACQMLHSGSTLTSRMRLAQAMLCVLWGGHSAVGSHIPSAGAPGEARAAGCIACGVRVWYTAHGRLGSVSDGARMGAGRSQEETPSLELPLLASLIVLGLLLAVQAFFTASEIGYLAVSKTRAAQLRASDARGAKMLYSLAQRPTLVLSTMLIGITSCVYVIEVLATVAADRALPPEVAHYVALLGTAIVVLILAEVTPIVYAIQNPERVALRSAPLLWVLTRMLWVVVVVLRAIALGVSWVLSGGRHELDPSMTEAEIKEMADIGQEQGVLEEEERRMLHGVFRFTDAVVGQVMVPRPDMVCVAAQETVGTALRRIVEENHTRLPVYEGDIDKIVGILYAKDLLPYIRQGKMDTPSGQVVREAPRIPESSRVREVLRELQHQRRAMAIVVDEYGGVAGLVTLEDLLEEIVGEIEDEFDAEEALVREVAPGEYLCEARASIQELNDALDVDVEEAGYDTVGGLVYDLLGHIPEPGESCEHGGLELTVEQVENRRIAKVRIARVGQEGDADEA